MHTLPHHLDILSIVASLEGPFVHVIFRDSKLSSRILDFSLKAVSGNGCAFFTGSKDGQSTAFEL